MSKLNSQSKLIQLKNIIKLYEWSIIISLLFIVAIASKGTFLGVLAPYIVLIAGWLVSVLAILFVFAGNDKELGEEKKFDGIFDGIFTNPLFALGYFVLVSIHFLLKYVAKLESITNENISIITNDYLTLYTLAALLCIFIAFLSYQIKTNMEKLQALKETQPEVLTEETI
jgi:magnesium-transporting ATPase (P-type)